MLSVKQGVIKYHFKVFGMTQPGIEPRSPGALANTLPASQLYFEQFSLAWVHSLIVKTVLIQLIQFSVSIDLFTLS